MEGGHAGALPSSLGLSRATTLQMALLWDQHQLTGSLAYYRLSAWLTCYLAGGPCAVGLGDSRFPPGSALWDYAPAWLSHMATWIQTPRCPGPQQEPQGCLSQLASLGSYCCCDFIRLASKCQILWSAVTASGWASLFCLHPANSTLGFHFP